MRDLASGAGFVVLAVVYFVGASGLPEGRGEPGPAFFPFILASVLLGLAVVIIIRGLRERQGFDGPVLRPVGLVVLTTVYAFAFSSVGFLISTLVYTAGVVLVLGERGRLVIVIPLLTTAFIYGGFVIGLGVALP
jgi:putative tricarboxylic transport membrane protein